MVELAQLISVRKRRLVVVLFRSVGQELIERADIWF